MSPSVLTEGKEIKKMLTIIALPTYFIASTTEIVAQVFTDLQSYIFLIIGVILGLVAVEILVGALRK
jgi:hypothetical protein